MHMSDALVSPVVAVAAAVITATLVAVAVVRLRRNYTPSLLPLMGVMGAFVFAAQMLNFTIPGTGSSGHLVGGVLLAAVLGPWAGFLSLAAVLTLQCLLFADGGLMALGCNIFNMAAVSCLLVYPMLFRPIAGGMGVGRIAVASVLSSIMALLLGAVCVTLQTELSHITALPTTTFLSFMLPIHLAIGVVEGVATALVLGIAYKSDPMLLEGVRNHPSTSQRGWRPVLTLVVVGVVALVCAGWISDFASPHPDGLEWSVMRTAGESSVAATPSQLGAVSASVVGATALLPDYKGALAGVVGALILVVVAFVVAWIAGRAPWRRRDR
ncbi:MAG: energy-coupling factor ABC transporter permease [Rikenellaceae bacterium]|nr:energy-coupling factor ABC transporter permease [Rikenellaceae bacterium]